MSTIALQHQPLGMPDIAHQIASITPTKREIEFTVVCGYAGSLLIALMARLGDSSIIPCSLCWPEEFVEEWTYKARFQNRGHPSWR